MANIRPRVLTWPLCRVVDNIRLTALVGSCRSQDDSGKSPDNCHNSPCDAIVFPREENQQDLPQLGVRGDTETTGSRKPDCCADKNLRSDKPRFVFHCSGKFLGWEVHQFLGVDSLNHPVKKIKLERCCEGGIRNVAWQKYQSLTAYKYIKKETLFSDAYVCSSLLFILSVYLSIL